MREGRCLCGAVRLQIDTEPMAVRTCWCRLCQYLGTGSVCFPAEAVRTQGEVRLFASKVDSGNDLRRGFCSHYGTPFFSMAEQRPHLMFVRAGVPDDRSHQPPRTDREQPSRLNS